MTPMTRHAFLRVQSTFTRCGHTTAVARWRVSSTRIQAPTVPLPVATQGYVLQAALLKVLKSKWNVSLIQFGIAVPYNEIKSVTARAVKKILVTESPVDVLRMMTMVMTLPNVPRMMMIGVT